MFTGIIEQATSVTAVEKTDGLVKIQIQKPADWDLEVGESVGINGVCTTVMESDADTFQVDIMNETLRRSTFDTLDTGTVVNLERAMMAQDRLSGHIVQGHVDGIATVMQIAEDGDSHVITFELPDGEERYVIDKGSITVNGISLTVVNPEGTRFSVSLIPHTWKETNLYALAVGDRVNIEYDVIAKYVEQMVAHGTR